MAMNRKEMCSDEVNEKKIIKKDFATNVMSNLYELKKSGEFCDVVLHAGDTNFSVHKVVLVSSSPYFNAMFRGNMNEKFQDKVCFEAVAISTSSIIQLLALIFFHM